MKSTLLWSVLFAVLFLLPYSQLSAQQDEDLYEDGTVWTLTFIRTAPNQSDNYLKDLSKTWVSSMEEAKAEGLIVDYKILSGSAANDDDYNLILMIGNKNFASFDADKERDAKWSTIFKNVREKMGDEFDAVVKNYDSIRHMNGIKVMREVHLKK